MTLASPETVRKAHTWLSSREWAYLRTLSLVRSSNLVIFSKRTWLKAYAKAESDFQRRLLSGEIGWACLHVDRQTKVPNTGKSMRNMLAEAAKKFADRLLEIPGIYWLNPSWSVGWVPAGPKVDKKRPKHEKAPFGGAYGSLWLTEPDGFYDVRFDHPVFQAAQKLIDTCQEEAIEQAREQVEAATAWTRRKIHMRPPVDWIWEAESKKVRAKKPRRLEDSRPLINFGKTPMGDPRDTASAFCTQMFRGKILSYEDEELTESAFDANNEIRTIELELAKACPFLAGGKLFPTEAYARRVRDRDKQTSYIDTGMLRGTFRWLMLRRWGAAR